MTRRHRKPKTRQDIDSLIVIAPGPHVVELARQAVADARAVAHAKRIVERALRDAGIGQRQANALVAGMKHVDLLSEAERVRAASEPAPEPSARPWWRRFVDGWRQ